MVNETNSIFPDDNFLLEFYQGISNFNQDFALVNAYFRTSTNDKIYQIIYFNNCEQILNEDCSEFADGIFMKANKKKFNLIKAF